MATLRKLILIALLVSSTALALIVFVSISTTTLFEIFIIEVVSMMISLPLVFGELFGRLMLDASDYSNLMCTKRIVFLTVMPASGALLALAAIIGLQATKWSSVEHWLALALGIGVIIRAIVMGMRDIR